MGKKNSGSYIVATQDEALRKKLREIPGVPILKLEAQCPVLEEPSESSVKSRDQTESEKCLPKEWEKKVLPELSAPKPELVFKKKKKKGKNPLSCMKKKKKDIPPPKKVKQTDLKPKASEPSPSANPDAPKKRVRSRRMKQGKPENTPSAAAAETP